MKAFGDGAVWKDPVVLSNQSTRTHHRITAKFNIVANNGTELGKPGWDRAALHWNFDVGNEVFHLFLKTAKLNVSQA